MDKHRLLMQLRNETYLKNLDTVSVYVADDNAKPIERAVKAALEAGGLRMSSTFSWEPELQLSIIKWNEGYRVEIYLQEKLKLPRNEMRVETQSWHYIIPDEFSPLGFKSVPDMRAAELFFMNAAAQFLLDWKAANKKGGNSKRLGQHLTGVA